MAMPEKLVSLNNENSIIYNQITRYLKRKARNNQKTSEAYERIIRGFFDLIKQKQIEFLTIDDVQITLDDVEEYMEELLASSKEFSNKTINYNVGVIKKLIEELANNGLVKDIRYIKNNDIEKLSDDTKSYDVLTEDEVLKMAELVLTEKSKGEIKHYLIKTAYDTMYRKDELLKLKWKESFEVQDDEVYIKVIGKRKKIYKRKIARDFYNELLSLKEDDSEYVFNLSLKAIDRMMGRLKEQMNISPNRNIVFHSIRKAGGTDVYEREGIVAAQKALNHTNVNTTQLYIAAEDHGVFGGISSSMSTDLHAFENVTHDELIDALNQMSNTFKIILNKKLKVKIDK